MNIRMDFLINVCNETQGVAVWLAAIGTISAVVTSLWITFRGNRQSRILYSLLAIPVLIKYNERAAVRLELYGNIFPSSRDKNTNEWRIPSDVRALNKILENLNKIQFEDNETLNDKNACSEKRNHAEERAGHVSLLIPHILRLIKYHKELERLSGLPATTKS